MAPNDRHEGGTSVVRVTSFGVIRRVAVLPHPPLLVDELVPGPDQAISELRAAVVDAVSWLRDGASHWVAVGADTGPAAAFGPSSAGSFAGYGADVVVSLSATPSDDGVRELPLPVLIAGWLRGRAPAETVRADVVGVATSPEDCAALGRRLGASADDTALLVLGDGSNRHGDRAPGGRDDRAPGFDSAVAAALADVDAEALAGLDPVLAAELGAVGRAPWQIAAGVAATGSWRGRLLYSDAPFGVGYHVALWESP